MNSFTAAVIAPTQVSDAAHSITYNVTVPKLSRYNTWRYDIWGPYSSTAKIQVFWYVNAVMTGSYERFRGPSYVRVMEICDEICWFLNLGTRSEYMDC